MLLCGKPHSGPSSAEPARRDGCARVKSNLAVGCYLGKLLLPVSQCAFISDLPTGPLALSGSARLLAAITAAVAGVAMGQRVVTFLLLVDRADAGAVAATIVAKIPAAPIAERYLYLPSVGFCLLVGSAAVRLCERLGRDDRDRGNGIC